MKSVIRIPLHTSEANARRLLALQQAFAVVCNAIAPRVRETRCWNRVALHHMVYKDMRQRFPELGSQMICNAIYSVARASRLVYQHPKSAFNVQRHPERPLPRLEFKPQAPVFFDRHTLSLKDGQVSLFTLDGRIRFGLDISADMERRFREDRLREIVLSSQGASFSLSFHLESGADEEEAAGESSGDFPAHLLILDGEATHSPAAQPLPTATLRHE